MPSPIPSLQARPFEVPVQRPHSLCRGYFGHASASMPGVATLAQARAWVDPYIHEVRQRRREMGK